MHRPVRVGFVVHVMQVAGAEVLVREAVRRLAGRIAPTVFCLDRVGQIGEELLAQGVDVVCLNRRPGWDFAVSRRLAAEARARRIEVFHAHQYTPFFYTAFAKLLTWPRPKLILTEHGRHYPDVVSPARRAFNRLVLDRLADEVNACVGFSGRALSRIDGFRGNRIEIIDNGIEVERYGPGGVGDGVPHSQTDRTALRVKLGIDPARRYIVHVARHHPVKDQPTLLRGFALAAPDLPDVDLLLVGDGPLRGELEAIAKALGVADRVKFLGIRPDIPDVLAAADVFALTSVSEAASLTLLEAMATGLPVVVTDVGGNPDLVRAGIDGLLFPRGDAAGCAAAFRRLFTEPGLTATLGANGRQRVREKYRLEQTIERYWGLYRQLG
jgi:glycosyltransferase involved in cell wall biosynthesis